MELFRPGVQLGLGFISWIQFISWKFSGSHQEDPPVILRTHLRSAVQLLEEVALRFLVWS